TRSYGDWSSDVCSSDLLASGPFYLGDATADHTVDFQNGINLNGATRSFQTIRGVGSVPEGKLSGVISGAGTSNFSLDAVTGYAADRKSTRLNSSHRTIS